MSDPFDPARPEGSGSSHLMSKRDLRTIVIILVVLGIALIPIYRMMAATSMSSRCVTNLQAINAALGLYEEAKDGRFPPAFAVDPAGSYPLMIGANKDMSFTWASDISIYMKSRASFSCPAASPDEEELISSHRPVDSDSTDDRNRTFGQELLSYGFYSAYSTFPLTNVASPDRTVVIAESSNLGARGTLDPLPFMNDRGQKLADGFALGWDNSNQAPDKKSKSITRLSFYGKDGARHGLTIHALTASGQLINLDQQGAELLNRGGQIQGIWSIPPTLGQ